MCRLMPSEIVLPKTVTCDFITTCRGPMEVYRGNGSYGPYMMDHTPSLAGGYRAFNKEADAIGYIRALV